MTVPFNAVMAAVQARSAGVGGVAVGEGGAAEGEGGSVSSGAVISSVSTPPW